MFSRHLAKNNTLQNFSKKSMSSIWGHVKPRPSDPILGLVEEFKQSTQKGKVNLTAGTYKTEEGKPYVLNCVKIAQKRLIEQVESGKYDMEYMPIEGLASFIQNSLICAYSKQNKALQEKRIAGIQALSGTGSLRVGFEFLNEHYQGPKKVLIPDPSWPNHKNCVERAGMTQATYRYYDRKNKNLDLKGLLEDLDKAENGSVILLHVCAHNPTGMDPNKSQWQEIHNLIKKKKHFPFFDMAYQGFASGDLEKDAYALRLFADSGMNLALAQSYAKNFGLYGQRVGCFSLICNDTTEANNCLGQLKFVARAQYSNPPKHGAYIVDTVLSDPDLTKEWHRVN